LNHYLVLAAFIFCMGIFVMITKRNAVGILIGVELLLNAANLNLVAFSVYGPSSLTAQLSGQITAMFVIVLAAAEAAVAIAIFMNFYNLRSTIDVDLANELKG
jgi:NADH-quinone oxidoreductase subunit K